VGVIGTPGVLIVLTDVEPDAEEAFNQWYDEEHVPERVALRGVSGARRFRRNEGAEQPGAGTLDVQRGPKYLVIYELDDLAVLHGEWADLTRHHSDSSRAMYLVMANTLRESYALIGEFHHDPPASPATDSS
jgi:hypothetical protein